MTAPKTDDAILAAAQRRLDEKRAAYRKAKATTPAIEPGALGLFEKTGTCRCGAAVRITVPTLDGKPLPFVARWVPTCPTCLDADEAAEVAVERAKREAEDAAHRRARVAELAIPALYAHESLDTFVTHGDPKAVERQQELLRFARKFVADWPRVGNLYAFLGAPGTGKGHLAYGIARALVEGHGMACRVVKLPALIRDLRAPWAKDYEGPSVEAKLAAYHAPDLLVIDEVSRHSFYGQNVHQHLYDVLDARLEAMRPTILTSNESEASLREVLNVALTNRLEGEGGIVTFPDASYRTRGKS